MTDGRDDPLERLLAEAARGFPYPPAPSLAAAVRERLAAGPAPARRGWVVRAGLAAAVLLVAAAAVLAAVPDGRSALAEALGLRSTRVRVLPDAASLPTPTPGLPFLPPSGREVSPAEASSRLGAPLRLPSYPPDAATPERLVALPVTDRDGRPAVVVAAVHRDPATGSPFVLYQARLAASGAFGYKGLPEGVTVEPVTVRGQRGLWFSGPPHVMEYRTRDGGPVAGTEHLATGVLNWEEGGVAYRLETDLPLAEALRIAESLR